MKTDKHIKASQVAINDIKKTIKDKRPLVIPNIKESEYLNRLIGIN